MLKLVDKEGGQDFLQKQIDDLFQVLDHLVGVKAGLETVSNVLDEEEQTGLCEITKMLNERLSRSAYDLGDILGKLEKIAVKQEG